MIITPPAVGDVEGHAAEMFKDDLADDGFVSSPHPGVGDEPRGALGV